MILFRPCGHPLGSTVCGYPYYHPIHDPESETWKYHPYQEDPMPKPTVTVATVTDARGETERFSRRVVLDWPNDADLPRMGTRVAVAGSADAILERLGVPEERVFVVDVGPDDELLLRTGHRIIVRGDGTLAAVIGKAEGS